MPGKCEGILARYPQSVVRPATQRMSFVLGHWSLVISWHRTRDASDRRLGAGAIVEAGSFFVVTHFILVLRRRVPLLFDEHRVLSSRWNIADRANLDLVQPRVSKVEEVFEDLPFGEP